MSNRIAVVCEGPSDFPAIRELIDQTLIRCPELDWINEESELRVHRTYCDETGTESFIPWRACKTARSNSYRQAVREKWGEPLPDHPVEIVVQRVILRLTPEFSNASDLDPYIVIVKDTDADAEAHEALKKTRTQYQAERLVIGIQHTELECWLLSGFDPETDIDKERLRQLNRDDFPKGPGIGFDPRTCSERLTATGKDDAKLSPKRVLRYLTREDKPNVGDELSPNSKRSLHRDRHAILKDHGGGNGLADFLRDIEQRMIFSVYGVKCS